MTSRANMSQANTMDKPCLFSDKKNEHEKINS